MHARTRTRTRGHTHTRPRAREFTHARTRTHTRPHTHGHAHGNSRTRVHAHAHAATHTRPRAREFNHARTRTHAAHHVDIWFGVSPLPPQIAVCWPGDGYGHVLWPPRTSPRMETCKHLQCGVADIYTETCRSLNTRTPNMQHDRTRTHIREATPSMRRHRSEETDLRTQQDADTAAHPSHCTVSRRRGSHQIRLAPARDYTHYIHVCLNLVSVHVHDRC